MAELVKEKNLVTPVVVGTTTNPLEIAIAVKRTKEFKIIQSS